MANYVSSQMIDASWGADNNFIGKDKDSRTFVKCAPDEFLFRGIECVHLWLRFSLIHHACMYWLGALGSYFPDLTCFCNVVLFVLYACAAADISCQWRTRYIHPTIRNVGRNMTLINWTKEPLVLGQTVTIGGDSLIVLVCKSIPLRYPNFFSKNTMFTNS
jgi:hypothetical protein